jgi:putative SOS response-associated peptidase YedK
MCGRYVLTSPAEALRKMFGFVEQPNLEPRINLAPTQDAPVIRQRRQPAGERTLQALRWGLVVPGAVNLSGGAKMINARGETVAELPSFRTAFRRRRCLVPANGFYEWRPGDTTKQPHLIARPDGAPFGFAGLWERWTPPAGSTAAAERPYVDSFTIVTTAANQALAPLHHRQPVIVAPEDYAVWLDPDAEAAALLALLKPVPEDFLVYVPVDRRINNFRNDEAALLSGTMLAA